MMDCHKKTYYNNIQCMLVIVLCSDVCMHACVTPTHRSYYKFVD